MYILKREKVTLNTLKFIESMEMSYTIWNLNRLFKFYRNKPQIIHLNSLSKKESIPEITKVGSNATDCPSTRLQQLSQNISP